MPKGFNVYANLKIKGPNLQPIISKIKADLKGITVNVNVNINQNSLANLNRANSLLSTLNKNLRQVVPSANAATQAIRALGKAISNSQGDARKFATDMATISKSVAALNRPVKQASGEISTFGELLGATTKKLLAWGLASGSIVGLAVHMKEGFSSAIRFQREMVKLSQVGGDTGRTLKSLENEITRISTSLGVSSEGLVKVAVTLRQAGLSATDTKKALDVLAKTELAPTFDSIEQTTEGVIAIMSQFKTKADDLNKVMSQLNTVSARYAVESGDIIEAVKRAGGAFKAAGGDFQEFMALFTSVRATTRETAESISTGMRTIFARFERPQTLKSLQQLGIVLSNKGEFVGPFEAIKRISDALAGLPANSVKFAKIMEQLGGTRQLSKIIPLIKEFGIAQEALNIAKQNTNSLDKDAVTAQEALLVKLTKLKEQFQELFRIILNDSVFKKLIDLSLNLATGFVKVTKALSSLLPLLTALMTVKLGSIARGAVANFGTGFNKGAKLTFASGGSVPGNGSGDTVPAMLTPGEFVITKHAAQRIGYSNLNRVNKYADGGTVKKGKGIGVETLRGLLMLYGLPGIDPAGYARRVHLVNNAYQGGHGFLAAGTYHPGNATIVSKRHPFTLLHELGHAIDYKVGSTVASNPFLNLPATELYKSSHPFKDIAKTYHDLVKRHFKNDSYVSMSNYKEREKPRESFANAFAHYVIDKASNKGITDVSIHDSTRHYKISDTPEFANIRGLFDEALPLIEQHSRTPLKYSFNSITGLRKFTADRFRSIRLQQKGPRTELQFAGGGFVPGSGNTDSVRAMLTPGEFVVNKHTAQSIGYGNLNAINHYASGGQVKKSYLSRLFSELPPSYPEGAQFVQMQKLLDNALKAGGPQSQHEMSEEIIEAIRNQFSARNPNLSDKDLKQAVIKELRSKPTMMVGPNGDILGSKRLLAQDREAFRTAGKKNIQKLEELTKLYEEEIKTRRPGISDAKKLGLAERMAARDLVENGGGFTGVGGMPNVGGGSNLMKFINRRFRGQGRLARGVRRLGRNAKGIALTGAFLAPFVGESVLGTAENPGFAGTTGAGLGQIGGAAISGGAIGFQVGGPGGAAVGALVAATGALINFKDQLEQVKADKINKQFSDAIGGLGTKNYNSRALTTALGDIGADFGNVNNRFSSSYTTRAGQISGGLFNSLKRRLSFGLLGESRDVYRTRIKNENQAEFSDKYKPAFESLMARVKELSELNSGKTFQELMQKFPDLEKAMLTLGTVDAQQAKSVIKLINAQARLAAIAAKSDSALSQLMTTFDNMKTVVELTTHSFEKGMRRQGVGTGAFFSGTVSGGTEGLNLNALGSNGVLLKQFTQPGGLLTQIRSAVTKELSSADITPENVLAGKTDFIQNLSKHSAFKGVIGNALLGQIEQNFNSPEHMGMFSELQSGHRSLDSVVKTLMGNLPEELKNAAKTMESELSKISHGFQGSLAENFGHVNRLSEERGGVTQFGIEQSRIGALNQIRRLNTPFFHNGQFLTREEEEANANVFFAGQSAHATQTRLAGLGGVTGNIGANALSNALNARMATLGQLQAQHEANPNDRSVMQQIALTTSQIGNLRAALKNLASSTTELDAAQHRLQVALEKEAMDRQAREHVGESIAFGNAGSRQQLLMAEMLTQHVARNGMGAFMMLNDQQRQMVGEHLSNTAGMPVAPDINGVTRGQMRQGIVNFFAPPSMRNPNEIARLQANVAAQQNKMNEAAQLNFAQEEQQIAKSFIDSAGLFDNALKRLTSSLEEVIQSINGAKGKSKGGMIYASGGVFVPRGTDTVPAMLTPGEFVVNKAATAKNFPLLNSINKGKYMDNGGVVDNTFGSLQNLAYNNPNSIKGQAYYERQREIIKRQARRQQLGLPEYIPLSRRQPIPMTNAFNDVTANELHHNVQIRRRNNENREFAARFQNGTAGGILQGSPQIAQKSNQVMQNNAVAMNQFNAHSKPLVEALNSFPREISIRREGTIQVVLNGAEVMAKVKGDLEKEVWGKIIDTIQTEVKKSLRTAPL